MEFQRVNLFIFDIVTVYCFVVMQWQALAIENCVLCQGVKKRQRTFSPYLGAEFLFQVFDRGEYLALPPSGEGLKEGSGQSQRGEGE